MMRPKQKCIESSLVFVPPTPRYQHPQDTDSLPVLHFAVHLLPRSVNNTSFQLQDGCLLNELTLCIFDSSYWWSGSLRLTWHKGSFCSWFFVSFPCVLLVVLCSLIPHLFSLKRSTLKGRLFCSASFYSLYYTIYFFFYTTTISPSSSTPHFLSSAQSPCTSLACPAADLAFVG